MKRSILLAFAALTLFSCSKSGGGSAPEPETNQPTLLLKRVTETSDGESKVNVEFTYDGKQLTKASYYRRANGSYEYEHAFNYDAQGKLINVTENRSQTASAYVKSDLTYFTNVISKIVLSYSSGRTQTRTLTFGNDRLVKSYITNSNQSDIGEVNYTYNASGNLTKIENIANNSFGQSKIIDEFTSFDDKKTPLSALPLGIFYQAVEGVDGLDFGFGQHNPTVYKNIYTQNQIFNFTLSYTYNSSGYPTTMTFKQLGASGQDTFTYEYIEVK